ncbi:MAG: trypsin-like peptidase domain-containing protein [Candidatus Moranbacteria bacterium]|nr:trypsin-like peptidase domain-containing protein [Candidatus Moranbacteria bacterium]
MEEISPGAETTTIVGPPHKRKRGQGWIVVLFVLVLGTGFIGGVLSPVVLRFVSQYIPAFEGALTIPGGQVTEGVRVVTEENAVADLVEKNSPGVVSIVISRDVQKLRSFFSNPFGLPFSDPRSGNNSTETEKQRVGSGSGFFVSSDGLIVTNKHVVADEQAEYTVILGKDKKEYPAKVLARDPSNDIAVIKIEGQDFPVPVFGDSDTIRVGETVIAIGNPLGEFENSVSRGIVSGLKRSLDASSGLGDSEHLSDIIQIDAAINPGNSGGPLFNLAGEVIGVNVAMARGAENIGFTLPINQVKRIVEQVRMTGKQSFPYLGVRSITLTDALQKKTGLPFNYGALVLRGETLTDFAVVPGSPADKAGIVENDIILEINGEKVDMEHGLVYYMARYAVGDTITVKLWHKGETKEITVRLEERQ